MRRIFLVALLAACGGKHSAPAAGPAGGGGSASMMGMHHEGEHDEMSPELKKFHDALAPRWHAAKGPERQKDTCDAVPEFTTDADAIGKATPPTTTNADTWTAGTRGLVDAVTKLGAACKANDAAQFDTAFLAVHDAFHGLMGQAGMHHEEGMEGMEGMHHEGMGSGDHQHKM
ncbi:MAG TPA: hypothetical protein VLB44_17290 [Kofleriaceae bacterium]|nr:hypothetical protein [Kofleriaceae bacterium]